MKIKKIDNSMVSCFLQECERKFFYQYVEHLRRRGCESALIFGEAIHKACDVFWAGVEVEAAVAAFRSLVKEDLDEKRTVSTGTEIVREYYNRYSPTLHEFELIGSEESLVLPFQGFDFWGKIDKIVRWSYGISAIDHKTSSYYLSSFRKTAEVSHQFTGYMAILKQLHEDAFGLIVDMIHVPKPNKDGSLYRRDGSSLLDFDRILVNRSEFDIEEWKGYVRSVVGGIERAAASGEWRKFDKSCYSYNRECPYKVLCERQEPLEEVVGFAKDSIDFEVRPWEPWKEKTEDDGDD